MKVVGGVGAVAAAVGKLPTAARKKRKQGEDRGEEERRVAP